MECAGRAQRRWLFANSEGQRLIRAKRRRRCALPAHSKSNSLPTLTCNNGVVS